MISRVPVGNVGEWSELYTLGYLLVSGGAYAADRRQNPIRDKFYKVIEVYLAGKLPIDEVSYVIMEHEILVRPAGEMPFTVGKKDIKLKLREFFQELTAEDNTRTFPLETGAQLMALLSKKFISASSAQTTSDLDLILEDKTTKLPTPRIGFSIKSQLGSASTLLNASGATNFLFKVTPPEGLDESDFPTMEPGAVRANIRALDKAGFSFEFVSLDSQNFTSNLELVDSNMPANLAKLLFEFYSSKSSNMAELSTMAFPPESAKSTQQVFKLKQFLGAVAMGLRPTGEWDGDVTRFKGLIVVKVDGDVVFYYLYNLTDFQEFLFDSVKLEVASTTRHKFGELYRESGDYFVKLNLQIRFIK